MIIGLTGMLGAGKGAVADILVKEHGFIYTSLSDVIREIIKERKEEITRENLTNTAKEFRDKEGPEVFAKMLIGKIDISKNYVIDSIRHPKEVEVLRTLPNFYFIEVIAPLDICLKRLIQRNRENDPKTMEELQIQIDKENNQDNQKLNEAGNLAYVKIENNQSINALKNKISFYLDSINKKF